MNWTVLAGSLAGVLGLAALSRLLGLGRAAAMTREEAISAADDGGLVELPARALVSNDGRAAVVIGSDDRMTLVRRNGVQRVARPLSHQTACRIEGDDIVIDLGERMFGPTRLTLDPEAREELLTTMSVRE